MGTKDKRVDEDQQNPGSKLRYKYGKSRGQRVLPTNQTQPSSVPHPCIYRYLPRTWFAKEIVELCGDPGTLLLWGTIVGSVVNNPGTEEQVRHVTDMLGLR